MINIELEPGSQDLLDIMGYSLEKKPFLLEIPWSWLENLIAWLGNSRRVEQFEIFVRQSSAFVGHVKGPVQEKTTNNSSRN